MNCRNVEASIPDKIINWGTSTAIHGFETCEPENAGRSISIDLIGKTTIANIGEEKIFEDKMKKWCNCPQYILLVHCYRPTISVHSASSHTASGRMSR